MDKEAIIRYKFHLCRNFLDKLLAENLITAAQKNRKGCHKAYYRGLNSRPLLLIMIGFSVDISAALVIDKPEPFRYTVL